MTFFSPPPASWQPLLSPLGIQEITPTMLEGWVEEGKKQRKNVLPN
jgi:hypothetical protein